MEIPAQFNKAGCGKLPGEYVPKIYRHFNEALRDMHTCATSLYVLSISLKRFQFVF